jgi:hypothetical protein
MRYPASLSALLLAAAIVTVATSQAAAQSPAVRKVGDGIFEIGQLRVDTVKRELSAPGVINDVMTIEFLANTKGGLKAYECALTIESDAITFNAALMLLGLDPARGRPSKFQFDPETPGGDPVEIHLEFKGRRVRAEQLLLDQRSKKTLPIGPWVYTGSTFYDAGHGKVFLAEQDGVLIGLMHGPAAIIENPRNDAVNGYGYFVINPALGIPPGSKVSVIVTALKR